MNYNFYTDDAGTYKFKICEVPESHLFIDELVHKGKHLDFYQYDPESSSKSPWWKIYKVDESTWSFEITYEVPEEVKLMLTLIRN